MALQAGSSKVHVDCAFATQPMAATPTWTDLTPYLAEGPIEVSSHGRPDEFATVEPSRLAVPLDNSDGRFTRGRVASPYYPNVRNGRRVRYWTIDKLKNWVRNPTFDVDISGWAPGGSVPPTLARGTTVVHSGAGSLTITWGTGGVFPQAQTDLVDLELGMTYTASAWLRVPSAQGGPHLKLAIGGGPVGSPTDTLDLWQLRTVTFVATSTTMSLQVWPDTSPTAGGVGRVDDVQVEEGLVATAFDPTPAISYRFDGHVDAWPTEWTSDDVTYATCLLTATDRLKRFGGVGVLRSMVEEEILRDEVSGSGTGMAYYTLSEPVGAVSAANVSRLARASVKQTSLGAGTIDFGAGTGPGTDGLSAPIFNPTTSLLGKFLSVPLTVGVGFFGVTLEAFFRPNTSITSRRIAGLEDNSGNAVELLIDSTGHLAAQGLQGVAGQTFTLASTPTVNDNTTHHAAVTLSLSGSTVTVRLYLDGTQAATTTYSATGLMLGTQLMIGGRPELFTFGLFAGTLSHVAAHSAALAAGRIADHYNAGNNGLAGERTDQRIDRVATWAGIPSGDRAFDVGLSTVGAQSTSGRQPLEVMRQVEVTEAGVLFISGDAKLTFHSRSRRYNRPPDIILDAAANHLADAPSFPADDLGLVNDLTVTRPNAAAARAVNQASIDEFGLYRDTLEVVAGTDDALMDAAQWRTNAYAEPRTRVPNITVDLLTLQQVAPQLVGPLLRADISTKLRVVNLPPQAPTPTVDLFVEGWTERTTPQRRLLVFNTSPGDVSNVWQLGVAGFSELGVTTRLAF